LTGKVAAEIILNRGRLPENARILIIKTQAIGDLLMTTPAIRDIRAAYPAAHLALMVGSWSAPAIRKNPSLDEIIEFDDRILLNRHWFEIIRLLFQLRRKQFDCVLIFHPSPFLHFFALLSGIPLRYGLMRGQRDHFLTEGVLEDLEEGKYYPANFQKVAALTGAKPGRMDIEVYTDMEDERQTQMLLEDAGVDADFLLVAPGGGRNSKDDVEAKRWPKKYFVELLMELKRTRSNLKIVLCGSEGDREETDFISRRILGAVDLTGRTTLPQLFCLAGKARSILCNDSAIMHIGVARGTPVVAPFGPTSLKRFLPEWARIYSVQSKIACSPCYVGGHFPGCTIGFQCMRDIGVAQVRILLESALDSRS